MLPWIQAHGGLVKHNMIPQIQAHVVLEKHNMLPWKYTNTCRLGKTQYFYFQKTNNGSFYFLYFAGLQEDKLNSKRQWDELDMGLMQMNIVKHVNIILTSKT